MLGQSHALKAYSDRGMLNLVPDSRVVNFKIFGVYQTNAWLDLKVFLIAMQKRKKNYLPARKSNHGRQVRIPSLYSQIRTFQFDCTNAVSLVNYWVYP
jgi:hypothetical protein